MYPISLLRQSQDIFPLFAEQLKGLPYYFDFSNRNKRCLSYDTGNFEAFQQAVFSELNATQHSWGIGRYLENRSTILRDFPQIVDQGRVFHAGLDIVVPAGFVVHAPLNAVVFAVGKEEEPGSYGGYVVLKHELEDVSFFSLYGHLNSDHMVQPGQEVSASTPLGRVGTYDDSGQWFTHTHLQVITEHAYQVGRMYHGYVSAEDLTDIERIFPSPYPLFRY